MLPCACPARDQIQIWCCSLYLSSSDLPGAANPRQLIRAGDGAKAPVLCSTDPGDGWIEKIRLDRRRGSFSASAEPYQSDPEGISAASPERTEIDWRLDITDPTSGCDGPVDNRRHTIDDASVRSGAARHCTEGKPKDSACRNVDPPL